VLFATGDVMAQQAVEKVGIEKHNLARTGRMALYGGAVFGPAATTWFKFLQQRINLRTENATIAARVLTDQTVFSTTNLFCFLSSMAIMEGTSPKDKLDSAYWTALQKNWMLWPFVQAINFKFVPLDHRVLVVNVVSLAYDPSQPTMATLDTPDASATNGNPTSPVPLDTIPISPAKDSDSGESEAQDASMSKAKDSDEPITVFHDKDNFNVKHPLMREWTLWFTKPPTKNNANWNDLLKEVVTFDSVEEFWGVYNNITPVSELALKSDYHLFKKGVRPEWEDPQNKHGGKWSYQFKERGNTPIDELWLHLMLAGIGETLENGEDDDEVMGVVVNVRKLFYRLGLWTKTVGKQRTGGGEGDTAGKTRSAGESKEVLMNLGRKFKEVMKLPANEQVEFSGHTESARAGSTRANAKFVV
ncbi:MAG: hypothetical protein Q9186_007315, partial [Xanthomendoza sp. 1 TL-2023]